jgi:hypothetical protein
MTLIPVIKRSICQNNLDINFSPNPFTKLTTINYSVPISGNVSMKLYNSSGRLIKTLVNQIQTTGVYSLELKNSLLEIPAGIYFIKFETGNQQREFKLIVQ